MTIKPLNNQILIQRGATEETTEGGIVLPESSKEKPAKGVVIAVPEERRQRFVNVGDTVLFGKYAGTELVIGSDEYLVVRQDELIAVIDE